LSNFFTNPRFFLSIGQFLGVSAILSLIILQLAEQKSSSLEHKINLNNQLIKAADDYIASLADDHFNKVSSYSEDISLGIMENRYLAKNLQLFIAQGGESPDATLDLLKLKQIIDLEAEREKSLLGNMTIKLAIEEMLALLKFIDEAEGTIDIINLLNERNTNIIDTVRKYNFEDLLSLEEAGIPVLTKKLQNVNSEIDEVMDDTIQLLWNIRNEGLKRIKASEEVRNNIISMSSGAVLGTFFLQLVVFIILQSFEYREGRILYDKGA